MSLNLQEGRTGLKSTTVRWNKQCLCKQPTKLHSVTSATTSRCTGYGFGGKGTHLQTPRAPKLESVQGMH